MLSIVSDSKHIVLSLFISNKVLSLLGTLKHITCSAVEDVFFLQQTCLTLAVHNKMYKSFVELVSV